MSPSGIYDHGHRRGVPTRCSICGASGVNRTTCPKTTPEDHLAVPKRIRNRPHRKQTRNPDRADETRYEREWERSPHVPLTAERRAENASARTALVGQTITQPGPFSGARIQEHIVGSQYRVLLRENIGGPPSPPFYAHHKIQSQSTLNDRELIAGWTEWEDDYKNHDRKEAAMDAMDEAIKAGAAAEEAANDLLGQRLDREEAANDLLGREEATMAPPKPQKDHQTLRVELLGARLEDDCLWSVFKVGNDLFYGPLSKFDPLDLIRKPDGDE